MNYDHGRTAVQPMPKRRPMPDLRCCPYCQRSVAALGEGQGHRLGCAVYGSSREVLAQDVEAAALRGTGGVVARYVRPICSHGFDDWTGCPACTHAADYDGGAW